MENDIVIDRLSELEQMAHDLGVLVNYSVLRPDDPYDGLFMSWGDRAVILINRHRSLTEQIIALAEELGHYHRSCGDSLSMQTVAQIKSEIAGRTWAYEKILPASRIQAEMNSGASSIADLAELVDLPCEFVRDAIEFYQRKDMLSSFNEWHNVV